MADIEVVDNREQSRFEARVDGEVAGFAAYKLRDGRIVFTHTDVDDAFGGQGVGGALARGALDQVRAAGDRTVVAMCPFIAAWIDKHPDYQDLLAP